MPSEKGFGCRESGVSDGSSQQTPFAAHAGASHERQEHPNRLLDMAILSMAAGRRVEFAEVPLARGFFGNLASHEVLAHHHLIDRDIMEGRSLAPGKGLLYGYPLIQYKVWKGQVVIVALERAIPVLNQFASADHIDLGGARVTVHEISFDRRQCAFGLSETPVRYRFVTPWLALNQDNVDRYRGYSSLQEADALLARILVGNVLSMSKRLGYTVEALVSARLHIKERPCLLKGTPVIGFVGTFEINFHIPDFLGLGKSVSRGFGTLKRIRQGRAATPTGRAE